MLSTQNGFGVNCFSDWEQRKIKILNATNIMGNICTDPETDP